MSGVDFMEAGAGVEEKTGRLRNTAASTPFWRAAKRRLLCRGGDFIRASVPESSEVANRRCGYENGLTREQTFIKNLEESYLS